MHRNGWFRWPIAHLEVLPLGLRLFFHSKEIPDYVPTEEVTRLVSGEYKTGILFNTLECTDSSPTTHTHTLREDSDHPSTGITHIHPPSRAPRDPQGFAFSVTPSLIMFLCCHPRYRGRYPLKAEIRGPGLWTKAWVALATSP